MATDALGLYVHIPFCVKKCNYCDFCSFPILEASWRGEYIDRLCEELCSYKDKQIAIDSIFFGGGTPSLLTPLEFDRICSAIKDSFVVLPDTEFTVESNPKTLDEEKLMAFVRNGVNRLSIGLQSIHKNEEKSLGRIHNYEDFLDSYALARRCGIKNINVDLMYGIPEQTMASFEETLSAVCHLSPEHISLYGLILEEGTPFYKMKDSLSIPSEDTECDMYYLAARQLSERGYSHYEISNYAKDGYECRHNLKYWHCDEYIGVGLSAYSYFDKKRFGNTDDPQAYLSGKCTEYDGAEEVDPATESYEYVMLRLRLKEGFSLSEYKNRFGRDFSDGREELLKRLSAADYLKINEGRIALTEKGFYISNSILTELI